MGRHRRAGAAIAAVAAMLGGGFGNAALACSSPLNMAETFAMASAVVIGHAVKAVETRLPGDDRTFARVTIRSTEILKGRAPPDGAVLWFPAFGAICGELLLTGRDYLIFIGDSPEHWAARVIELPPGSEESARYRAELRALARQVP